MKHQLQALSMPAESQLHLLPDFVCKGDELAEDYGHWCLVLLGNDCGQLTEQQRLLLTALDNYFVKMTENKGEPLWTDKAITTRSEWAEVRTMAVELLNAFQWPAEEPAEAI
jgi:hypothetical protein